MISIALTLNVFNRCYDNRHRGGELRISLPKEKSLQRGRGKLVSWKRDNGVFENKMVTHVCRIIYVSSPIQQTNIKKESVYSMWKLLTDKTVDFFCHCFVIIQY